MNLLSFFRRRPRRRLGDSVLLAAPGSDQDYPGWDEPEPVTDAIRAVESGYQPHAAPEQYAPAIQETLAELVAQAQAEAATMHFSGYVPQSLPPLPPFRPAATPEPEPEPPLGPPPVMPYPSGLSRVMVGQIEYPDPAAAPSPDKDRAYREMLRRVGVATGTHAELEDTCTWALPALEPGDGTGEQL